MSYAGISTSQLTPELLQQLQAYQDQQKQQSMAKALMQNSADPRTSYAGLSNAGSDIGGAIALKSMQNKANAGRQVPLGQGPAMDVSVGGVSQTLPGMNMGTISSQTPSLGGGWLKNLFSMGGA